MNKKAIQHDNDDHIKQNRKDDDLAFVHFSTFVYHYYT